MDAAVRRFPAFVVYKAQAVLISEASRYKCGWLWWVLEPVLLVAVLFFVFSYVIPGRAEGFLDLLAVGVVAWLWFSNCVTNAVDSIQNNHGLISQVAVPKLVFPMVPVLSGSLKGAISLVILLGFIGFRLGPEQTWFWLPLLLTCQLIVIVSFSMAVALVTAWIPDFRFIVTSLMQLTMFCSGVFYDISRMPEKYREVLMLNPIAFLIDSYRTVLVAGEDPAVGQMMIVAGVGVLMVLALVAVYQLLDQRITRRVVG